MSSQLSWSACICLCNRRLSQALTSRRIAANKQSNSWTTCGTWRLSWATFDGPIASDMVPLNRLRFIAHTNLFMQPEKFSANVSWCLATEGCDTTMGNSYTGVFAVLYTM